MLFCFVPPPTVFAHFPGPATIDAAAKAGANAIVAGSATFVEDAKGAIDALRASVEEYCTGPGEE